MRRVLRLKFALGLFESPYVDSMRSRSSDPPSARWRARWPRSRSCCSPTTACCRSPASRRSVAVIGPERRRSDGALRELLVPESRRVALSEAPDRARRRPCSTRCARARRSARRATPKAARSCRRRGSSATIARGIAAAVACARDADVAVRRGRRQGRSLPHRHGGGGDRRLRSHAARRAGRNCSTPCSRPERRPSSCS